MQFDDIWIVVSTFKNPAQPVLDKSWMKLTNDDFVFGARKWKSVPD